MKATQFLLTVGLALLMAGCATGRINWDSEVGTMTYRQAINKFGPPSRQEKLADGKLVAQWISHYTYAAYDPAMDNNFYNNAASLSSTIQERQMQRSTLSLTFDTKNILSAWSRD